MTSYQTTPLFGGALVCDLPSNFADVSKLRQVPDNQEVWIDRDGFTSLVFEIDERVGEKGNGPEIDGRAMTTHLEEIVGDDIDRTKVWNTTPTLFSKLEYVSSTFIVRLLAEKASPDFTAIILTLVRLEREKTDLLVTINVPHIRGEYNEEDVDLELGRQGKLIGDAVDYAARIWETFKVKDWNLFNEI
ncbi:Mog1p/PsbP-like protein [Apiospora phragmitis]|uniref:Mog1p/PsbP-like protein n=1 Tax=Apiospora phragmitis TaxID=2905665 RepID=A0ABR1VY14_9PEZI